MTTPRHTLKQAASLLSLSPHTLRRMAKQGRVSYEQDGAGPLFFTLDDINVYRDSCRKNGVAEKIRPEPKQGLYRAPLEALRRFGLD